MKRIYPFLLLLPIVIACQDPYNHDLDKSKLNYLYNDQPENPELDDYIYDNFTEPYNIAVKYRFDASELNTNKTLVPPYQSQVPVIMNVVKEGWILPYIEEAGETFFKTFCPKQFVLVGSPEYNTGGTITLGTAEGGRKVVLYVINDFEDDDRTKIKEQLHTIHHEFGHILNQNIPFADEFKQITPGDYTADWNTISTSEAQSKGFITPYSMSAPTEDFVEIVATMLTEGKRGYDRIVCSIPSESGQAKLKLKEQIVVNYYSSAYNIDFYKLQEKTETAIDAFAPKSLIRDLGFQSGQNFNSIVIDPAQLPPLPTEFMDLYNASATGVEGVDAGQFVLDYVVVLFDGSGGSAIRFVIRDTSDPEQPQYAADFYYSITIGPNEIVTFDYDSQNGNATFIGNSVQPLLDYFQDNTFFFDWIPYDTEDCVFDLGGIFPQESPDAYSFGQLSN